MQNAKIMKRIVGLLTGILICIQLSAQNHDLMYLPENAQQQWLEIPSESGTVKAYSASPSPVVHKEVVIVVPGKAGLDDFEKSVVDKLGLQGYWAMAMDGDYDKKELHAVIGFVMDSMDDELIYMIGFGEGGTTVLDYAGESSLLNGIMVFYSLLPENMGHLEIPVHAFYGSDDKVLAQKLQDQIKRMEMQANFIYTIFPGASHNFMQKGADDNAGYENRQAYNESWQHIMKILGM